MAAFDDDIVRNRTFFSTQAITGINNVSVQMFPNTPPVPIYFESVINSVGEERPTITGNNDNYISISSCKNEIFKSYNPSPDAYKAINGLRYPVFYLTNNIFKIKKVVDSLGFSLHEDDFDFRLNHIFDKTRQKYGITGSLKDLDNPNYSKFRYPRNYSKAGRAVSIDKNGNLFLMFPTPTWKVQRREADRRNPFMEARITPTGYFSKKEDALKKDIGHCIRYKIPLKTKTLTYEHSSGQVWVKDEPIFKLEKEVDTYLNITIKSFNVPFYDRLFLHRLRTFSIPVSSYKKNMVLTIPMSNRCLRKGSEKIDAISLSYLVKNSHKIDDVVLQTEDRPGEDSKLEAKILLKYGCTYDFEFLRNIRGIKGSGGEFKDWNPKERNVTRVINHYFSTNESINKKLLDEIYIFTENLKSERGADKRRFFNYLKEYTHSFFSDPLKVLIRRMGTAFSFEIVSKFLNKKPDFLSEILSLSDMCFFEALSDIFSIVWNFSRRTIHILDYDTGGSTFTMEEVGITYEMPDKFEIYFDSDLAIIWAAHFSDYLKLHRPGNGNSPMQVGLIDMYKKKEYRFSAASMPRDYDSILGTKYNVYPKELVTTMSVGPQSDIQHFEIVDIEI